MIGIEDKNSIQGKVKWKIKNKDILNGEKEITYVSPGGYSFKDKQERIINFDWQDSGSDVDLEEGLIISELYSLDYDFINNSLNSAGYNELTKEEHRLELFKEFDKFEEIFLLTDVDEEEVDLREDLDCVYFELYDPISNKVLMLIGECEIKLKPEEIYG